MRVAYLQTRPGFLRVRENLQNALNDLEKIRADLVVLPELFNTGYNFQSRRQVARVAEPVPGGPTTRALLALAKRRKMAVAAGLVERAGGKFYNAAVLATPEKVHLYRKIHLFAREKKLFSPGNLGFNVFPVFGVRVGLMVCFDWFFPEACRTLALKGAQVIAHPANLVLPWCPEAMKVRCLENRVFAVTANRVGRERDLAYIGQSQIVSPQGEVLHRASRSKTLGRVEDIDPRLALRKNLNPFNHLFRDRRPAFYR